MGGVGDASSSSVICGMGRTLRSDARLGLVLSGDAIVENTALLFDVQHYLLLATAWRSKQVR